MKKKPEGKLKLWSVLAWLAVWTVASLVIGQQLILPTPLAVAERLWALLGTGTFWLSIAVSFWHIVGGFFLAVFTGVLLAATAARFRLVGDFLAPLMAIVKATPVASFIILMLVWVSSADLSILASFLMGMPIVYSNVFEGIRQTDPKLLEMAKVFRLSQSTTFRYIYVSQVLPFFRSAVSTALAFCWKAGVAAEIISIPDGTIGEKLYKAKIYLQIPDVFAWTIVIITVSFAFERIFLWLLKSGTRRLERM